jgi:hypothetical protein
MPLYDRMRGTAGRLLEKYNQGVVEIGVSTTVAGANEWDPPTVTTTWTRIDAVVSGVSQKYVDGTTVLASDRQVLCQGVVDMENNDMIRIDGDVVSVVRIINYKGAGEPVASVFIVR